MSREWGVTFAREHIYVAGTAKDVRFCLQRRTSFGPTLIRGFGFDRDITALLNIPFG